MAQGLTEREILGFLASVEAGTVTLAPRHEPQFVYAGAVEYTASNGWSIVIWNDCNVWDYIEHLRTPDGRECDFDDIVGKMPDVEAYVPSPEATWERYRIPGYMAFRCTSCGEALTDRKVIAPPYRCSKCLRSAQ